MNWDQIRANWKQLTETSVFQRFRITDDNRKGLELSSAKMARDSQTTRDRRRFAPTIAQSGASFRYILAAKLPRSDTLLVDVVTRPATTAGLAAGASRARPWTLRTARRLRIWLSKLRAGSRARSCAGRLCHVRSFYLSTPLRTQGPH